MVRAVIACAPSRIALPMGTAELVGDEECGVAVRRRNVILGLKLQIRLFNKNIVQISGKS